jgi:hypothetical protein
MACDQSTPDVPEPDGAMNWFASPTPMIEPISVCDELAGSPSHQVPRFQTIAAISNARISSTGSSDSTLNATAPEETMTPRKLKAPDHTTAACGGRLCV